MVAAFFVCSFLGRSTFSLAIFRSLAIFLRDVALERFGLVQNRFNQKNQSVFKFIQSQGDSTSSEDAPGAPIKGLLRNPLRRILSHAATASGGILLLICLSALPLLAADLDAEPRTHPRSPPQSAQGPLLDPNCRIIPQPQLDLYGYVRFFRPTIVCFSRGLLADSFQRW